MKLIIAILLIVVGLVTSGCHGGIKGKVIDNVTGNPIENALVVVQWTRPDIHSIEGWSIAVISNFEVLTDKDGQFVIKNTPVNPFARPVMIIYKEGYIPWRNDMIFPGGSNTLSKGYEWKNAKTYQLEVFTDKFTTKQIESFLFLPMGGNETPVFEDLKRNLRS